LTLKFGRGKNVTGNYTLSATFYASQIQEGEDLTPVLFERRIEKSHIMRCMQPTILMLAEKFSAYTLTEGEGTVPRWLICAIREL